VGFDLSRQLYKPAKTASGIPYYIRTDPGSYSETFRRNGSQITAEFVIRWDFADTFVRECVGYTYFAAASPDRFVRILPMNVPYRKDLWATDCTLVTYGTFADDNQFTPKGYPETHPLTGETPQGQLLVDIDDTGSGPQGYWPRWGHALYRVTFVHKPYRNLKKDSELPSVPTVANAPEFDRYIRKWESTKLREMRRPDFGFETDEATPVQIPVVGFTPSIEKDIYYTWYEVPYEKVPSDQFFSTDLALKVNAASFDGYPAGTLLYVGAKDYEDPYRSPSGDLYVDPTIQFRFNPYGWNKVYLPTRAPGATTVNIRARAKSSGEAAGGPPYVTTNDFYKLFRPKA
jgi:hypothetical protein